MERGDPPVLVIGYGNTLCGDDGLGWIAAAQLEAVLPPECARVIACHQLTVELAEPASRARLVILIDAQAGSQPGTLTESEVEVDPLVPDSLAHHVPPAMLLGCVQALYDASPRMVLLTICGECFGYGEGLSPCVQAALPRLLERAAGLAEGEVYSA